MSTGQGEEGHVTENESVKFIFRSYLFQK